jgi:hypothetical protein
MARAVGWGHGMAGNFSHQGHILTGGEAGDQIIKLKDKTHGFPAKAG